MAIFYISNMATVRHLGFVMSMFRQLTNSIWWSLSLYKVRWNGCSSLASKCLFMPQKMKVLEDYTL